MTAQKPRETYPADRASEGVFCARFIRLMFKACAAHSIGIEGVSLLTAVVMVEDSKRYAAEPRFWCSELRDRLGGISQKRLRRTRQNCIDAGWLHFEAGTNRTSGRYWVLVPEAAAKIGRDATLGERPGKWESETHPEADSSESVSGNETHSETDSETDSEGTMNGNPFLPVPDPKPTPTPNATGGGGDSRKVLEGELIIPDPDRKPTQSEIIDEAARMIPDGPSERERMTSRLQSAELRAALSEPLSKAGSTAEAAFAIGHTVDTVSAVCEHAESRPKCWGGGAVRARLTDTDLIGLPASEGWAKPDPTAVARLQSAKRKTVATKQVASFEKSSGDAAVAKQIEQLEADHGAAVDRLDRDQAIELLNAAGQQFVAKSFARSKRSLQSVRPALLRAMSSLSEPVR